MIDVKNCFDQLIKNYIKTNCNFRKTYQGNDYITDCLLDYIYFKKHYKW